MCEVYCVVWWWLCCNGIVSSGQPPSLPELLRLKVPQEVGANYFTFGIFLLNDQTGSRVNAIDDECRGKSDRIIFKMLQEWLEGKGLPVTWASLVQTLRDTGLSVLADQIQASKMAPWNVHSPQSPDTPNSTHHTSPYTHDHYSSFVWHHHISHLYITYIISSLSHVHLLDVACSNYSKFSEAYCGLSIANRWYCVWLRET